MGKEKKYRQICQTCGCEFKSVNPVALTCSTLCRSRRYSSVHHSLRESRNCIICNHEFEVTGKCWGQKFCSPKCRDIDERNRYRNDLNKTIKHRLRCRLNEFVTKRNINVSGCIRHLGCSVEDMIHYLESKFQEGMSWSNYGRDGWHIDHILPLASFDLTDIEQLKKACHYTNLQPLWAKDNLVKSNKILNNKDNKNEQ